MLGWDLWKKGFDAWEGATADYLEKAIENPLLLGPSGAMLKAMMETKAGNDKAMARWLGLWGLATKRDQERTLHMLNQIQSRLIDIEHKLDERP
jgi:ATP-dependent exoDNAse (exonuclease V) alpha subunit